MARLKPARVSEGEVQILVEGEYLNIDDALPLCEAQADSIGWLLMGQDEVVYLANTQRDLAEIKDQLSSLCEQVSALAKANIVSGDGAPMPDVSSAADQIKQTLDDMELT